MKLSIEYTQGCAGLFAPLRDHGKGAAHVALQSVQGRFDAFALAGRVSTQLIQPGLIQGLHGRFQVAGHGEQGIGILTQCRSFQCLNVLAQFGLEVGELLIIH